MEGAWSTKTDLPVCTLTAFGLGITSGSGDLEEDSKESMSHIQRQAKLKAVPINTRARSGHDLAHTIRRH